MAEAVVVLGLVSSIASLVDLSAKVVSRLHDFASKTSDIPDSFCSLSIRLPLLTACLGRITVQAQAGRLPKDVTKALQAVVDSTLSEASVVQARLSSIIPPENASKIGRVLKALKSLAKEDKIRQAVEKVHKHTDFLVLHQTTQQVDTGDRILEELLKLSLPPRVVPQSVGIHLGQAPQIDPDAFIGRTAELQQLRDILFPTQHPHRQCIISISGMGGVGKTQLSLAHVRDCANDYSSVFWLNARDETSLRQSMADLNAVIIHSPVVSNAQSVDDEKVKIELVRQWLSEPGNDRWLLIFDNYDDPHLSGIRSPTGYDIRSFFPPRSHGSIIITSRSPRLTFGKHVRLQKLEDFKTGVATLSQRSGRDLSGGEIPINILQEFSLTYLDSTATDVAKRLDGLPLALATAGAYLQRTGISCHEYHDLYHSAWLDLVGADIDELCEYEARTLASTWIISLDQVRRQDKDAAELLAFLAYLSNRDIWYELIKAGASNTVPWMRRVTESKIRFQRAMSRLHDYNLVDVVASSYQVHPCLQDWLIESLNTPPTSLLFVTSLTCVADSAEEEHSPQYWSTSRRLLDHIEQLESPRFRYLWRFHSLDEKVLNAVHKIASVLLDWNRHEKAEQMYQRALAGKEKALGPDHTSTLSTVKNLGTSYHIQGKLKAAEQMYQRALVGCEKTLEPDHTLTLGTVKNLGILFSDQGKLHAAEQMYQRALAGNEKILGPDHTLTLSGVHYFGNLYRDQGKLNAAEQMYQRTLAGYEKTLGPDHTLTLGTLNNLGNLYIDQGKLDAAEQMYQRALAGYEKTLGPDHTSTLGTVNNPGNLYSDQGKLDAAEQMYQRTLAGNEKTLGPDHTSTLGAVHNLGNLYRDQGKLDAAEQMSQRALAGYEKTLGPDHTSTLSTVNNLGLLCHDQGKLHVAEQMYQRALAGHEKTLGLNP